MEGRERGGKREGKGGEGGWRCTKTEKKASSCPSAWLTNVSQTLRRPSLEPRFHSYKLWPSLNILP